MDQKEKAGQEGARKYNREAEEFAKTDKGERAAEEARDALDTDEAEELREAERRGRAPARQSGRK